MDVLSHDCHLHWDRKTTSEEYLLHSFLETGGSEPESWPWLSTGHKNQHSDSDNRLFGPDSAEDKSPGPGPTS
jgi:hypothetical protein